jgi:hypothetical protein
MPCRITIKHPKLYQDGAGIISSKIINVSRKFEVGLIALEDQQMETEATNFIRREVSFENI